MIKYISLFLLLLLFTACATTTSTPKRYLLENDTSIRQASDASAHLLIDNVEIAGFLDKSGIVYQTEPNQINVATRHIWAEPLNSQVRRSLYSQLSGKFNDIAVYQNAKSAPDNSMRLNISIDAFHGRYDGLALVAGAWRLIDQNGQTINSQPFQQSVSLTSDGYPELVRALSLGLEEVIIIIAASVSANK